MANITQLTTISAVTDATTFVVINDATVKRVSYLIIKNQLLADTGKLSLLTDVNTTGATDGQVLKYNSSQNKWIPGPDNSGGSGLSTRTSPSGVTSSLANNATGNISITGFKSYVLLKIQTSAAAWVRLYTSSTARSNDSTRAQTLDPTPGSGVIAEVVTSGAQTQAMTPCVFGFNDDGTPTTAIYAAVTNLSGSIAAITVTLTILQLET